MRALPYSYLATLVKRQIFHEAIVLTLVPAPRIFPIQTVSEQISFLFPLSPLSSLSLSFYASVVLSLSSGRRWLNRQFRWACFTMRVQESCYFDTQNIDKDQSTANKTSYT